MAKTNEIYLALVTLVFSGVRLGATGRAGLARRGPRGILKLTHAAFCTAQRAEFSRMCPNLAKCWCVYGWSTS